MKEQEQRDLFKNQSDCYADTGRFENDGSYIEGEVIQAMTEDRFIEVLQKINILTWIEYAIGNKETYPHVYDRYLVCRKDGKIHLETWNGTGWAYNNNVIVYWGKIINPML